MIKQKTGKCIDCPEDAANKPLIAKRCFNHYWRHRALVKGDKKAIHVYYGDTTPIKPSPFEVLNAEEAAAAANNIVVRTDGELNLMQGFEGIRQDNLVNPIGEGEKEAILDDFLRNSAGYTKKQFKARVKSLSPQKGSGTALWMEYHIAEADKNGWICQNCGNAISSIGEEARYGAQAHILPKNHFPSVKNVLENHLLLGRFDCFCHGTFDASWERASRMPVFPVAWAIVQKLIPLLNQEELRRLPEVFQNPLK